MATAAHQVEGGSDNNNWHRWEHSTGPDGRPRVAGGQKSGRACDHWNRYGDDIRRLRELGVDCYRMSLEWSKIEPEDGRFSQGAIDHYHEVIDALLEAEIEPMITLHHFTHPLWFEDLGGFEHEDNVSRFAGFAKRVFQEYGDRVGLWCTINEPAVFATRGWFEGVFPRGSKDPELTAIVIANLLAAHGRVYRALKALPNGAQAQIGLVKNIFQFDPARRGHLFDWWICRALDRIFNGTLLDCLESGRFRARLPGLVAIDREIPEAPGSLDFVGFNYYSHFHARFRLHPAAPFEFIQRPEDLQTDMPYPIYAEGFHRALMRIAGLDVPIYVTENGIADRRDDRRELYIRRATSTPCRGRSATGSTSAATSIGPWSTTSSGRRAST